MSESDVPSPIDLCDPVDARAWASTAQARPGRLDMFQRFLSELKALDRENATVLELGSGPGFLASFLLEGLPHLKLTLLDVSAAMHDLARARLGSQADAIIFVEASFKITDWASGLEPFDAVITNQSVHELRHKKYAKGLHSEVAKILKPGGIYLVCDHYFGDGGMRNADLFMTIHEQREALACAGFKAVEMVGRSGSLVMHRAIRKQQWSQ